MTAGSPPKPPPPPAGRGAPPAPIPRPRQGEQASQAIKDQICEMALGLLEEQVTARIVHYKAELSTNPELDAITAQVVEQLNQIKAQHGAGPSASRESIRASHERLLSGLLERVFRADVTSLLVERKLKEITRKLARLFFTSELHDKTRGNDGSAKVIQHGEQALYYVLVRYDKRLKSELDGFDYASDEVRDRAFELLARLSKDMQDAFLSRRSSELKRIVAVFNVVLAEFFGKHLASVVPELSREVIQQAATFEGRAFPYKITTEAFPRFRATFERRLMVRLVGHAEDQLLGRLADTAGAAREETVAFVTDPRIFSMIVGEICDGVYELLCNEGFLDLPPDWRQAAGASAV
ncbi:MAG: hypothetical protein U0359_17090 [Byssovorax sp.]